MPDKYPDFCSLPTGGKAQFILSVSPVPITDEDRQCEGYATEEITLVASYDRMRKIGMLNKLHSLFRRLRPDNLFEFIVKVWNIYEPDDPSQPYKHKHPHGFEILELFEYKP